jgi:hypothetical protein
MMLACIVGVITGILIVLAYYYGKFKGAKQAFDAMQEDSLQFQKDMIEQTRKFKEDLLAIHKRSF